jgi:hypothetical protein
MEPALFRFIGSGIPKQFMGLTGAAQRRSSNAPELGKPEFG